MVASKFRSHPHPIDNYDSAVKAVREIQASEGDAFYDQTKTVLLTHGKKVKRVVLWLHGYTATTLQFLPLARLCHEKGYNVLVPCLPHHGLRGSYLQETRKIRADELARFADRMVDIAAGLGEEVIVGGLSMGGMMTAWIAQERADVSRALIIAPFLGARIIPARYTKFASTLFQLLPDRIRWWDPKTKSTSKEMPFNYPCTSTRSLANIIQLGLVTAALGKKHPPRAEKVWMIINDHDESVNNEMCKKLVHTWQSSGAKNVTTCHFPVEYGLPHDCISLENPKGNTKIVYPAIMDILGE